MEQPHLHTFSMEKDRIVVPLLDDHPLIKSSHAVCGEKFRVLLSVVIYRNIED